MLECTAMRKVKCLLQVPVRMTEVDRTMSLLSPPADEDADAVLWKMRMSLRPQVD